MVLSKFYVSIQILIMIFNCLLKEEYVFIQVNYEITLDITKNMLQKEKIRIKIGNSFNIMFNDLNTCIVNISW